MSPSTAIDYRSRYEEISVKYEALKHELEQLKKLIYGSKHERFVPAAASPAQLTLGVQAEATPLTTPTVQKIEYSRSTTTKPAPSVPAARMKLPESLPRERIVIEPVEDVSGLKKIGEEITEELELIEARLYVK